MDDRTSIVYVIWRVRRSTAFRSGAAINNLAFCRRCQMFTRGRISPTSYLGFLILCVENCPMCLSLTILIVHGISLLNVANFMLSERWIVYSIHEVAGFLYICFMIIHNWIYTILVIFWLEVGFHPLF